jgi:hypothetical protein
MTQKMVDDYQKKAEGLFSYDEKLLESIPPEHRIIFLGVRPDDDDARIKSLKTLMTGIQDSEARALLGGDVVDLKSLTSQGITTSTQLRQRIKAAH